jgi:hypothetical protein
MSMTDEARNMIRYLCFVLLGGFILSCFTTFSLLERITTFPYFGPEHPFLAVIILGFLAAYVVKDLRKTFFVCLMLILTSFSLTIVFYSIPSLLGINPALEPVLFSAFGWSLVYSILLLLAMFFGLVIAFILFSEK